MAERNVHIGRVWPIMPNAVRVTVGTAGDMAAFQATFHQVMTQPSVAMLETGSGYNRSRMLS